MVMLQKMNYIYQVDPDMWIHVCRGWKHTHQPQLHNTCLQTQPAIILKGKTEVLKKGIVDKKNQQLVTNELTQQSGKGLQIIKMVIHQEKN